MSSSKKRAVESESEDESEVRVRVVVDNVKAGDASCGISGEVGVVFNVQPIIVNCNGSKNDGENGNCKNNDVKNLKSHKQVKTLKNAALEKTLGTNWMKKTFKLKCAKTGSNVNAKVVGVNLNDDGEPVWKLSCDNHGGKYIYKKKKDLEDVEEWMAHNNGKNRFGGFIIHHKERWEKRRRY